LNLWKKDAKAVRQRAKELKLAIENNVEDILRGLSDLGHKYRHVYLAGLPVR